MKNFKGTEWSDWCVSNQEIQDISYSLNGMAIYGATIMLPPDKIKCISEALYRYGMNTSKLLEKLDALLGGEECQV